MKKRCLSERTCRSTCKGEVVIINSGAGSNLVEAVLRKITTSVPFMICSSTGLSQWVRFIFFSPQYNEVKQFKWYFSSLATISPLDNFAIRLKSLRFYAAFLTRLCSSSVWQDFSARLSGLRKNTFPKFFWTLALPYVLTITIFVFL